MLAVGSRFRPRLSQQQPRKLLTKRCYLLLACALMLMFAIITSPWPFNFPPPSLDATLRVKTLADGELPLPRKRLDLTFYSTTRSLGPAQLTAIRSWLALGADVIVFLDGNITDAIPLLPSTVLEDGTNDAQRLRLLETPLPRSILGAPRLDLIMEAGEANAKRSNWVCLINADIVLPVNEFAALITHTFRDRDIMAIGERLDCRTNPQVTGKHAALPTPGLPPSVNTFADLERWSMAPCWPHGSGGKDYFLYRKGLFARQKLTIPPFWIGKFVWDHWLVNATRDFAVDVTPSLLVGHSSHEYDWNWRVVEGGDQARAAQKQLAKLDIDWNQQVIECLGRNVYTCVPYQSTYDVAYQLCPGGKIQPMPRDARVLYTNSVTAMRARLKPNDLARRVYETEALTGTSPRFWEGEEMLAWAREHGCKK